MLLRYATRALAPLQISSQSLIRPKSLTATLIRPIHLGSMRRPDGPSSVLVRASATTDKTTPATPSTFTAFDLSPELLLALSDKGLTEPTEIQSIAVPNLLRDRKNDFLIASHTGSGKTLAYLLPIVHILKEQEIMDGPPAKPKRPRALVLGPTRELTDQILQVAKTLSHRAKFRSTVINGSGDLSGQKAALSRPIDVLVGTPAKIVQHAAKGNLFYGDVDFVVLDEADTMLDRGFGVEVLEILKAVRHKPEPARCVLVSATMTKQMRKLLSDEFPSMRLLETTSLHKGVVGAKHTFLPLPGNDDKLEMLLQVVEGEHKRGKRIMVFCNTLDSARAVDFFFKERSLPNLCYHGDVPLDERRNAILDFSKSDAPTVPVLVCTDLAARGLDIPGKVDHIVNFDFPLNPVDYLHRTGRTARAGASGKITSLIAKPDRVLAARIEEALSKGLPLDALSSDRAVLPPHMRPKKETFERRAVEKKMEGKKGVRGAGRLSAARNGGTGEGRSSRTGGSGSSYSERRGGGGSSRSGSGSSSGGGGGRGTKARLGKFK